MKISLKSIITAAAITAAVTVGGVVAPAQAATYGYVYLVASPSVCSAVKGTSPTGFLVANSTIGWTAPGWDYGDRVTYPRVALNTTNRLTIKIACRNWLGITMGYADRFNMPIVPSYYNQSITFY